MGGGNDLFYLNHIIIVHCNASYGCGKCLKIAFVSSSALHNHKKVCLGFTKKPATGSDSKPSSSGGGNGSHSGSTRATPKKKDSKAPAANSQGSSTQPASTDNTTPQWTRDASPPQVPQGLKEGLIRHQEEKKKKDASPARKSSGHKVGKDSSWH